MVTVCIANSARGAELGFHRLDFPFVSTQTARDNQSEWIVLSCGTGDFQRMLSGGFSRLDRRRTDIRTGSQSERADIPIG
jgi:hypothetical protein